MKPYSSKTHGFLNVDENDKGMSYNNLYEFSLELVSILLDNSLKLHIDDNYWKRTVKINVMDCCSRSDFDLTDGNKKQLIENGREAAIDFKKQIVIKINKNNKKILILVYLKNKLEVSLY